jgi:hypothetical protein
MIVQIVFMAFLAISSAANAENHQEIEKGSPFSISSEENGKLFFDPYGYIDEVMNGAGYAVFFVFAAGILLFSFPVIFDRLRRYEYKRKDEVEPYQEGYYSEDQYLQNRYKRFATNDIASKMAQLEQAFKKYQVEEAECELYIACEASQEQRIEENGPLARIVFDILSTFNRAKDGHKWDDRMEGLVKAFEFGTESSVSGQVDPCQPLRNKCFELHAKY